MTLDQVLASLLFRRSYRRAFAAGARTGLAASDADALSVMDLEQLEHAARLACGAILRRAHRGSGTVVDAFPRTIEAWRVDHVDDSTLDELAARFAESPWFEAYRALPTCEQTLPLEEAFYRFAEDEAIGEAAVRMTECASAIVRAIVVTPSPSFRLPDFVRRAPQGFYAIVPGPALIAALGGQLVSGALTPFLAALLDGTEPPELIARRFGVSAPALAASCEELRRLGLFAGEMNDPRCHGQGATVGRVPGDDTPRPAREDQAAPLPQ